MHTPGGRGRFMAAPDRGGDHHGHDDRGPRRHGPGRPFDYGAMRLVLLGMIAEAPRHGYELMRGIEERMGGGYRPSPGVIYPTLAWLEDMGYAVPEAEGGRKSYGITPEGAAFLAANRAALDEIAARMGAPRERRGGRHGAPEPVLDAMHGLRRALRARFARGAVDAATVEEIAAAIGVAAERVEKTMPTEETGAAALTSTATVTTPKAASYAAQLVKHFAHKVPARFEGADGEIAFPAGNCRLHAASETLTMTVEGADSAAIARLQDVVASHLRRFAFREELAIDWQTA